MANRESNRQQQQNELEVIQVRVVILTAHIFRPNFAFGLLCV